MDTLAATAELWAIGRSEYHTERTADSHSSVEIFRESIGLYAGRFILNTIPAPEPTPAMRLGDALHVAVLEPEKWDDLIAVMPVINRRSNAGKAEYENFQLCAGDRLVITAEDYELVQAMHDGVLRNPLARDLLNATGRTEQAIRWTDPATGLVLKCRPDRVLDRGICLDLKSAIDPSPEQFARAVATFGYFRQEAFYRSGLEALEGFDGQFLFLAVGKSPPHEAVIHQIDGDGLELGRRQNETALAELAMRRATNNWESRWQGVQSARLPRWAYYTQEQSA